ncbi:MAG TPA: hypothetical protein VEJ16_03595 [Alphaproteobacteria bacterium]|nr:hypothetical protein [Alphaproteobacteria bacterium]
MGQKEELTRLTSRDWYCEPYRIALPACCVIFGTARDPALDHERTLRRAREPLISSVNRIVNQ